jgi:short-subunit dehydrogenase
MTAGKRKIKSTETRKDKKMEQAAIVTGASSGIGKEISRMLLQKGYEVFGIGRDFQNRLQEGTFWDDTLANEVTSHFHPVVLDLLDTEKLLSFVKKIQKEYNIFLLVNNAGVAYYGLHEELNAQKIQEMVRTNLEVPLILSNLLMRDFKRLGGTIINISSVTAEQSNPHGCAYGATKAGLSGFSKSLFDEARKYGVKVVTIQPDMTKTNLYRNADFAQGEEPESYLQPEEVAAAVEYALAQRDGMAVTEITIRPQIHRIRRR